MLAVKGLAVEEAPNAADKYHSALAVMPTEHALSEEYSVCSDNFAKQPHDVVATLGPATRCSRRPRHHHPVLFYWRNPPDLYVRVVHHTSPRQK